jgi:hypothetical protein
VSSISRPMVPTSISSSTASDIDLELHGAEAEQERRPPSSPPRPHSWPSKAARSGPRRRPHCRRRRGRRRGSQLPQPGCRRGCTTSTGVYLPLRAGNLLFHLLVPVVSLLRDGLIAIRLCNLHAASSLSPSRSIWRAQVL